MYHGIINVYKEKGMTSFDVVAALRRICGQKKIGHTGTLDPEAEGVLPVCLGKATRVCTLLTDRDKEYITTFRLGIETDTQDMTGTILEEKDTTAVTQDQVQQVIAGFVGKQQQIPPMYSARKVNGKRLYEFAREGITVERKANPVEIYEIEILSIEVPQVTMRVKCSKGTYIRTLCHDIGQMLGCGGAMSELLRTQAAGFLLVDARKLDEIRCLQETGRLDDVICPVEQVFSDLPVNRVSPEFDRSLCNGSKLIPQAFPQDHMPPKDEDFRVCTSDGVFVGIYRYSEEEGLFRARRIFYTE